ncbi:MAG: hypothetical protein AB7N80_06635 [Bdellovibrionales bacterium]
MKTLVFSKVLLVLASASLVTACGSGDQSGQNSPPTPPFGKPGSLKQDEASSAYGAFLVAGFSYLNQATKTAVLGGFNNGCRRATIRQGLPQNKDKASARARLVVESDCDILKGTEEYSLENVGLIQDQERGLQYQFNRATATNVEPFKIRFGRDGKNPRLWATHQLSLELSDSTANIYRFQLSTRWQIPLRDRRDGRRPTGHWIMNISGRIRANGKGTQGTEVYDLVVSGQGELGKFNRDALDKTKTISLETSSLNAAAEGSKVDTNHCGSPETNWASVYVTSLFPDQQLNLNFVTEQNRLVNQTTKKSYDLGSCGPIGWSNVGWRAFTILQSARAL